MTREKTLVVRDYRVVSSGGPESLDEFHCEIKSHLNNGYKLAGGVDSMVLDGVYFFSQAIVKYDYEKTPELECE